MNRGTMRDEARRIGRIPDNVADSVLDTYLNEANRTFQNDTKLLEKTVTFNVHAKFTMGTAEAFNLTVTGVASAADVVLATAQEDVTGAALATALQAIIQGSGVGATATTMAFSETTRKFTIEASAETATATSIVVTYPANSSYYDKTWELFGGTATKTGTTFVNNAAPFCTSEYVLPSDFLEVHEIIYNDDYDEPLEPEIFKRRSDSTGTPENYSIITKGSSEYIRFTPQPTTIGNRFAMSYYYQPSEIATGSGNDSTSFEYPARYQMALVYYTVYLYKLSESEENKAIGYRTLYQDIAESVINNKIERLGGAIDLSKRGKLGL